MSLESTAYLQRLSEQPERIRNFCMVAHVDHGKTTLSDYLVASNGILSPQLAGEVRLLDSRPDEQERCITMKASSIALRHVHGGIEHLVNLVDSPGHIDFSSEVSTAMRLCDGTVIIVDVVDGVTQQTNGLLRHAYCEGLSMCLVLNKVDLLITVQQLTPEEAYHRMRSIVEMCNVALAAFANQLKIQEDESVMQPDRGDPSDDVWFCPTKGNVLFCSCYDGWAFSTSSFAALYEGKLGINDLEKYLWGDHYLNTKTKTVERAPRRAGQQPLAVQLMIEPIWQLYQTFLQTRDNLEQQLHMAEKLGIPQRVWNNPRRDERGRLKALLSAWLPLAKCVLDVVCEKLDSPVVAQRRRLRSLIPRFDDTPAEVKEALMDCSTSPDAPCIVYVCKLIDTQFLVGTMIGQEENSEDAFIGFARVYSGRLRPGQTVYVHSDDKIEQATVRKVFLFRGAGLDEATEACSGTLCGVGGLTSYITKYATLSTLEGLPPFKPLVLPSTSIVRASVYPKDPKDLFKLVQGLQLLYRVDPQVEVGILPTGEHVIGTAGEVHLERCLRDLIETFACVKVLASEPLVSFRETIVGGGGANMRPKLYTAATADGAFSITLYARCAPPGVFEILKDDNMNRGSNSQVCRQVEAQLAANKRWTAEMRQGIVAWGPTKFGFFGAVLLLSFGDQDASLEKRRLFESWKDSIIAGFQAAAESGPMAQEPLFNVAFVVTDLAVNAQSGLMGGMVLPCVRDACRAAMELHPRRLVEPVYECTVYSSGSTQGKIYGSLSRRRSEIIEEVPNEGSDLFCIRCLLPAVEAFGLQDELRVATQGASTAQLQMSHWSVVDADPYFTPTTKEEIEEHGTEVGTKNIAEQFLERIRRRKGLHRERIVENAEKQKFSTRAT